LSIPRELGPFYGGYSRHFISTGKLPAKRDLAGIKNLRRAQVGVVWFFNNLFKYS